MGDAPDFMLQLANANLHSSSSWHREFEISEALKIAQQDENIYDEAICLELLGDIYHERGKSYNYAKQFENLDDIILSSALYNSTLLRIVSEDKRVELKRKLRETEEEFLKLCGVIMDKSKFEYDVDKRHKEKLEEFRQGCRGKLEVIQSSFSVFSSPVQNPDIESESRRAKAIEDLFIDIKRFIKEFVGVLLDECVHVLGPAPDVAYAFIGFGSYARCEITPFSDIESAILIEEGKDIPEVKDYFVKLVEYFNLKVLNLQETILPSMCIASLNDKNQNINSLKRHACTVPTCIMPGADHRPMSPRPVGDDVGPVVQGDWFYDNQMRGFSVDGRMSSACKTPLAKLVQRNGRNEDLIMTPSDMANVYNNSLLSDKKESEKENVSTVLANVSFLYGNNETLLDEYNAIVLSITDTYQASISVREISENVREISGNVRQTSAILCLCNALKVFEFSLNASDFGLISSIKQKLYRVVDLLVMNLGKYQYSTVVDNSPWNILEQFSENNISDAAYHNLRVIVGIVNEVRLTTYLRRGRQDEVFSFFDQSTDINFQLAKNFFVRFFYTMFPFQRAVKVFLSQLPDQSPLPELQFPLEQKFYAYSHLISGIALSLTSDDFLDEMMWKFSEAFAESENENTTRLCLAFLSCLHPDYSTRYCQKILESTDSNSSNAQWRIFSLLIGCLASFHQDNIVNVEAFLEAAVTEMSSGALELDSAAGMVVECYKILIHGLLKYREGSYTQAIRDFDKARSTYFTIPRENDENPTRAQLDKIKLSILVLCCVFMKGRCHMKLGNLNDSSIEMAMRTARAYTANGDYMRILYHAYIGVISLDSDDYGQIFPSHIEKVLELYLRFQCPQGQELWVTIPAQGILLGALFLGMFYRQSNRIEDALRIFQISSARVIPESLQFCHKKYHVGKTEIKTVETCIEAFQTVFKLLEAECLHALGRQDAMWDSLGEALSLLAKYHGQFQPIELQAVFATTTSRRAAQQRRSESAVWQTSLSSAPPAPRLLDFYTMAPTLQAWCDSITMALQYVLYTIDRDLSRMLIERGTPIVSLIGLFSNDPLLSIKFQSNPYETLTNVLPILRLDVNGQMIGEIFRVANSERAAMFDLIKGNVVECQHYAAEFTDQWIEVLLLSLRLSLCHDLVGASGILK